MGIAKYKELGIPYRLEGIPAATKDIAAKATRTVWKASRPIDAIGGVPSKHNINHNQV